MSITLGEFFKKQLTIKKKSTKSEIETLIKFVLKLPNNSNLILHENKQLDSSTTQMFEKLFKKCEDGCPIEYLTNEKEFFGSLFYVNESVLIPRSETELMVEEAVDFIQKRASQKTDPPKPMHFLDIGCGSGCIGISIAKKTNNTFGTLIEKSSGALEVAKKNTENLKVQSKIQLFQMDFPVDVQKHKKDLPHAFDLILANPPYIATNDPEVQKSVALFEPDLALYGGDDGLKYIKSWSKEAVSMLAPEGMMIFEIGYQQGRQAKKIFEDLNTFKSVKIKKDYSDLDRFVLAFN